MRDRGVNRLWPADKASFGGDDDERNAHQRTGNVVLALGDEGRLQRLDAVVVAMIDGARVFGRFIDDVPVEDRPARVRLVHVCSRQHRQRQGGGH